MKLSTLHAQMTYRQGLRAIVEGQREVALDHARSLTAGGHEGWGWALGGMLLRADRDLVGAQQALEEAVLFIPLPHEAACALGECYLHFKKPELALTVFRHLAIQSELPFSTLAPLASGLGRLGEYELALAVCREAAGRAPDSDEPLYAMAYFLRRLRRPPEVILSVLEQALRLAPDSHIYRLAVASLHHEMGDVEAAAEVLARLSPEELGCENCLKRMQEILDRAGDLNRSKACELRIERLRAQASQTSSRHHTHCRRTI